MGFFDKLGDKTINEILDETKSKVKGVSKKVKGVVSNATSELKEQNKDRKESLAPMEGAIKRYAVTYDGGLQQYPKHKSGEIGLNIMEDCFYMRASYTSSDWFEDMAIPYKKIKKLEIIKRKISNAEAFLGVGSGDMQSLEQKNVIEITYLDENDCLQIVRFEMLTGITVYAQAGKCVEFMDILRQNNILEKFKKSNKKEREEENSVLEKIQKLALLKDSGAITEEEFNEKKATLLKNI